MIRLERLSKTFRAGEREFSALEDVSFAVAGGEIVAILGPSGSGKTTLLNIIGGIDRPTSGKAVVGGADISTVCDRELAEYRRRQLGFVFQFYNLVPNLTVEENVEVCANISSAPLPTAEVLASVGMLDKRGKFPAELSGGEQQRTAIARAIVKNPAVLLCDEPTGALDYETSRGILKLLEQVNRAYGTTILIVTHNTAIKAMADRVVRLRGGRVTANEVNPDKSGAEGVQW